MSNKIEGVPEGWELVGIRRAQKGEFSVGGSEPEPKKWEFDSVSVYPIIRKLPTPLKVEAGKYYRTQAGEVRGPMFHLRKQGVFHWAYEEGNGGLWSDSGKHNGWPHPEDFVAEAQAPYRPFASAEEFKPHRDKWLVPKECSEPKDLCFKVDAYCDKGYDTRSGLIGWPSMFRDFQFEDGTPCGIKQ